MEHHDASYKLHATVPGCHGLGPWSLTMAATNSTQPSLDATGLARGASRSTGSLATSVRLHGASPWHPRSSVLGFCVATSVRLHGASPWHPRSSVLGFCVATSVRLHGASPWHPRSSVLGFCVATSARLHGASPWHLASGESCAGPRQRADFSALGHKKSINNPTLSLA